MFSQVLRFSIFLCFFCVPRTPQLSAEEVGYGGETPVGGRYGVEYVQRAGEDRSFSPASHSGSRLQDQQSPGARGSEE